MNHLSPFLLTLLCLISTCLQARDSLSTDKLDQLQAAIEEKMAYHNVPAAGIALVGKDGPLWVTGLGTANREQDIKADENTLFRIGSVSKMFVALAILKLQEAGKLSINDKIKDHVPEIAFKNKWEDTDPIRIAHLLEHTTGWDDFHLLEYASNDSTPLTLKQGLDYHPHSRESRWIPGTRMAYCNSGPPVAAYIVEKITGMPFEDYVTEHFFRPIGMRYATYFRTDYYRQKGAALYQQNDPQDYWHILMRPSGAINASARDMAPFIQFMLNRGAVDSTQIVSESSILRMETPMTTPAAQADMQIGYGLHNYTTTHEGFLFHGHNGGVNGGLTDLGYLPKHGIGHIVMINCSNGNALHEITNLVRDFEINSLERTPTEHTIADFDQSLAGYYVPINPRMAGTYFFTRLVDIQQLGPAENRKIRLKSVFGNKGPEYQPISPTQFINPKSKEISLVAVEDPLDGQVLHQGTRVLKPVSGGVVWGQFLFAITWVLLMIAGGLVSFFWLVGKSVKRSSRSEKSLRILTAFSSICCFAFLIFMSIGSSKPFEYLAGPGLISISLFVLSLLFAGTALWSVFLVFKTYKEMRSLPYWFYSVLAVFHLIVTMYLAYYGIIGIRTWT